MKGVFIFLCVMGVITLTGAMWVVLAWFAKWMFKK